MLAQMVMGIAVGDVNMKFQRKFGQLIDDIKVYFQVAGTWNISVYTRFWKVRPQFEHAGQ